MLHSLAAMDKRNDQCEIAPAHQHVPDLPDRSQNLRPVRGVYVCPSGEGSHCGALPPLLATPAAGPWPALSTRPPPSPPALRTRRTEQDLWGSIVANASTVEPTRRDM